MVLKRRTRHNTVFGAFPGAAPVLIGWAAVTGSLDWPALVFFAVVFCWQMPHFWALASRFREDYARAGVPMLSVVAGPVERRPAVGGLGLGHPRRDPAHGLDHAGPRLGVRHRRGRARRLVRRGDPPVAGRITSALPDRPMRLFSVSITHMTLLSIAIALDVLV